MSSKNSGSAYTPPKGRPTPGKLDRRLEDSFWRRWGVQVQWALIALVIVVIAVAVIALSDPRPLVHGG